GWVSGLLLGASIAGMIGSRAGAALISGWLSWRGAYALTAVCALACAWLVHTRVPATPRGNPVSFPSYLRAPLAELRRRPPLRRSAVLQMCTFAGFTATWTSIGPVLTNDLRLSAGAVGWVALVALAAMVTVPWTGQLVDRLGPDRVSTWSLGATLAAALLMTGQLFGGLPGLVALVAGVLLLDVAMQSGMVANVTRFYRIETSTRSTMNTAYMTCAFVAGSVGSWSGAWLYELCGWIGITALVAVLATAGLLVSRPSRRRWTAGPDARRAQLPGSGSASTSPIAGSEVKVKPSSR
ncbi:MAG: MFS transporter, partial [Micromonosporaceae bacterium]